ncbi:Zinc finger, C3HC4 type (RING finger)/Ring finger domain/RING-like zinc finger [Leishmania utingensis]|uniref:Zinc finger, C3HC4 type (RING finger)/Ring finger domain/RING-like zinc finger n=1 Tax=Leishmania utingensis TaxID=653362 RepID=A0AAW3AUQ5_9TRYP
MVARRSVVAYVVASFLTCFLFLADYANTYREFYSAMVALANSSSFRLVIVNTAIAVTVVLWMTLQFCFFGQLNASEETALLTSFTLYMVECIVVPLYMDQPIMSATSLFFLFTLAWRGLHKLASERVTTLSTTQMTWSSATRIPAYLCFAIICDVGLLTWMIKTRPELVDEKASMHYSMILIYMLLLSSSLRSTVHFVSLLVLRGQHTLLSFVADALTSIAESLLFVGVYAYIFYNSALPLLLLRGFVGHVLRIFEKASGLAEFLVLARRVRNNMPDATAEDLARDARCTICYEDMMPGGGTKRLPCGHCYHIDCLERWLEGHSTCPYCRANIMQMRGGNDAAAPQVQEEDAGAAATTDAAANDYSPTGEEAPAQQQPTGTPENMEVEIREAYERYRQQLCSPLSAASGHADAGNHLAVIRAGTGSPRRVSSPVSDSSSTHTKSITAAPVPSKTVDQLKIEAYEKYRKRLRESERELRVALRLAEEVGYAP